MIKFNKCVDCKERIDFRAKRCIPCNRKWQVGINNSNYKHGESLKQHYCSCGKEINWQSKKCYSCSQKIRFLDLKERAKCSVPRPGKLNPNWIDGRSFEPYTKNFTEELREQIRNRDNYTCQNCGMTEEEHLIVNGQVLHVHHIDYNKDNCKENNLITTCLSCNTRANYNRDYWTNYYKEKICSVK